MAVSFQCMTKFTTNKKKKSNFRQETREARMPPKENKPKTIKKMVIGSYILIIP